MATQRHEPEAATVSDVARLRGIALLAAAKVHQRVPGTGRGDYDITAETDSVVATAVRFAEFLASGK